MKVLFTVSEINPWVKTGGLGDVATALPAAMHATGGLADTVIDAGDTRRSETLQRRGMSADFSWRAPAQCYANLYHTLLKTH